MWADGWMTAAAAAVVVVVVVVAVVAHTLHRPAPLASPPAGCTRLALGGRLSATMKKRGKKPRNRRPPIF